MVSGQVLQPNPCWPWKLLGGEAVLLAKTRLTEASDVMGCDLGSGELPAEEVNTCGTQCRIPETLAEKFPGDQSAAAPPLLPSAARERCKPAQLNPAMTRQFTRTNGLL